MRIKKTKIPIYKTPLILIESNNLAKVKTYFKKIDYVFEDDSIFGHTIQHYLIKENKKYNCIYVLFNRKNDYSKLKHSIIAHECNHIANFVFEYIGADSYSDEPYTYLVEYLVKEICNFLEIKDEL